MIWVINNIISCSFSFLSSPGNFFRHSCTEWLTFCALAEWIVYSPIRFMNITTTSIWMATVQSLQNHFVIIRSLTTSNANTNHDVSICVCVCAVLWNRCRTWPMCGAFSLLWRWTTERTLWFAPFCGGGPLPQPPVLCILYMCAFVWIRAFDTKNHTISTTSNQFDVGELRTGK